VYLGNETYFNHTNNLLSTSMRTDRTGSSGGRDYAPPRKEESEKQSGEARKGSRKGAKYAEVAKKRSDFHSVSPCAIAALRELF